MSFTVRQQNPFVVAIKYYARQTCKINLRSLNARMAEHFFNNMNRYVSVAKELRTTFVHIYSSISSSFASFLSVLL